MDCDTPETGVFSVADHRGRVMLSSAALRILPCGDAALTVEFGDTVDPFLNALVLGLDDALKAHTVPGLQETIPTYRSLFVTYDPVTTDFAAISGVLRELAQQAGPKAQSPRRWRVPQRQRVLDGNTVHDLRQLRR